MAKLDAVLPSKELLQRDKSIAGRMLSMVRPYWKRLAVAMVCMVGYGLSQSAMAYMIKPTVDDIFINQLNDMRLTIALALMAIFSIKGISAYFQNYLMQWVGERIITEYRILLYAHLQKLSLSFFDKNSTGELMSRITNDVNRIQGSVTSVITTSVRDLFTVFGLAAVMIYMDWFLALIALLVFPVCMIPLVKLGRMLRKVTTKSQESMGRINVSLHETIGGVRIVKAFCKEDFEGQRFANEAFHQFRLKVKDVAIRAISSPLMEFFGGCAIVAILLYGGSRIESNTLTVGQFSSFLAATLLLYEPVKRMSNMWNELQSGLAAATRIYEILDAPTEVEEEASATSAPPTIKEGIQFKNVSFAYVEGQPVLKNINLTVPAGSILALVGNSGGGKTTMVNLLPRFYNVTEGSILFDGHDIKDYTLHALRSQIAIVTQQTFLFNDTVRANIAYSRPEATEEEIIAAAKAAYTWDFIQKMPGGLDEVIGESGVLLSGGERQRISIARALLSNRPILILDEATSSLDTQSEMYVQKALENLMQGRTTFVIAHRLSTVRKADHIVVMSGGKIVEEGTHEELLPLGGLYKRLNDMQFRLNEGNMDDESLAGRAYSDRT